jgi:hypothetical protein
LKSAIERSDNFKVRIPCDDVELTPFNLQERSTVATEKSGLPVKVDGVGSIRGGILKVQKGVGKIRIRTSATIAKSRGVTRQYIDKLSRQTAERRNQKIEVRAIVVPPSDVHTVIFLDIDEHFRLLVEGSIDWPERRNKT